MICVKQIDLILKEVKEQLLSSSNSFGEEQAWVYLKDTERSIGITREEIGLEPEEMFYSLRLHCNEDEFESGRYSGTVGIIDQYCTEKISDENLLQGITYMLKCNELISV